MNVEWSDEALSNLASIESTLAVRIKQSVDRLAETGKGDVKKLQGRYPPQYRLRVGDYRVRFRSMGRTMIIVQIAHRREAYR